MVARKGQKRNNKFYCFWKSLTTLLSNQANITSFTTKKPKVTYYTSCFHLVEDAKVKKLTVFVNLITGGETISSGRWKNFTSNVGLCKKRKNEIKNDKSKWYGVLLECEAEREREREGGLRRRRGAMQR